MDRIEERLDDVRRGRSDVENHLIDELRAGKISRREFFRRGTVVGMSIPLVAFIASACSSGGSTGTSTSAATTGGAIKQGGTATVSELAPAGDVNPLTTADEGGLATLGQAGQYLTWSNRNLQLEPVLAESWSPNSDASVWTFKVRQGVTFNDGTPLTADDVAASLKAQCDPNNKGAALSAFAGVLEPDGVSATDASTVTFEMVAPNGNFPYIVSSDNYNTIILPKDYDYSGKYTDTFIGTGPWKMTSFNSQTGVEFAKNPTYWQKGFPILDSYSLKYYADQQPQILALQSGTIDIISQFSASTGQALLNGGSSVKIIAVKSTAHRQVHMRVDQAPFDKKEIRQALALSMNRPELIAGLLNGQAILGNDSPFSPQYPSTDTTVPQRAQDLTMAQNLMSQAGVPNGFDVTLYTWNGFEIPQLAQLVQQAAKAIKINIKLQVDDPGTYYGKYWLDSPMGITDYGHRGVPNVVLSAPLLSTGTWNAAHFKDPQYDSMVKTYVAALDLDAQKAAAGQIEQLLLDQTPIAFFYFYNHMTATKPTVVGVETTGMGHIRLTKTAFLAS
jgi:peptide/nickel transport system substrate-binding protein